MRMIWTLYKKEISGFFMSSIFYVIAFLTTVLLSITFSMGVQNFVNTLTNTMYQFGAMKQQLNIHYAVFLQHLNLLNLIFIFLVPALGMRLLAEEKKNRTFDLLLTSPITSAEIVVGKFLAMLSVIIVLVLIAFSYFLITRRMIEFTWSLTLTSTLGIIMAGAVYSALSLFASSLTDNAVISFALGIVFNLGVWILGGLNEVFDGPVAKSIFEQISLNQHLASLIEGAIRTNGLIFFLSLIFLFCFLTERVIESTRWRAS